MRPRRSRRAAAGAKLKFGPSSPLPTCSRTERKYMGQDLNQPFASESDRRQARYRLRRSSQFVGCSSRSRVRLRNTGLCELSGDRRSCHVCEINGVHPAKSAYEQRRRFLRCRSHLCPTRCSAVHAPFTRELTPEETGPGMSINAAAGGIVTSWRVIQPVGFR